MAERQRVLMLTGASRGIGHATVKTFSDNGWRVLTISRQPFDARCPWEGGAKNHVQLDLSDMALVQAEMPRLRDIVGDGLDALINNAAVSPKRPDGGKINALEMGYADWLHIFNVNFFACLALVQGLRAPLEAARTGGGFRPRRRAGERGFPRGDRHRHPVARHRGDRRTRHPVAPSGQIEGGR